MSADLDRREFLHGAAVGGALVIGFHLPTRRVDAAQDVQESFAPNAWFRLGGDGAVTVTVDKSELGQGAHTALAMILAEELAADWSRVRLAPVVANPAGWSRGMSTGGSTSVHTSYPILRRAGAAGRAMLIAAAAAEWGVDAASCRAENGAVTHPPTGRRLGYGALAARAAALPVPQQPPLKDPRDFTLIGTRQMRLDVPAKADGSAQYGMDVRVPGMLVASIERCPVLGGAVHSFDARRARGMPGVRHVVPLDAIPWTGSNGAWGVGRQAGVAVVADTTWQAMQARRALRVEWDPGPHAGLDSAAIRAALVRAADEGPAASARSTGDAAAALGAATRRVEAVYETPFLYHVPLEPMACTAHVRPDGCDVWVGTQNQSRAQQVAAEAAGLPVERVRVHTMFTGGAFGRRLESDFVAEAVALSRAAGAPVKVVWTREDDVRHGFYRPATYNKLAAALDGDRITAWWHRVAGTPVGLKFGALRNGIDDSLLQGAANLPYAVPNVAVELATADVPAVPLAFWRSVGISHNGFVVEGFVDELAAAAGRDPFEFRRALLRERPRHLRTLELAAERAGWGTPPPAGRFRGIAIVEWPPSVCAQVAEVSVGADGRPRVHRVVAAIDCGQVVNLEGLESQLQGGVVFGLAAALYGEITIARGGVRQTGFGDYRFMTLAEAPTVEVHVVPSEDRQGGVGEPVIGPVAPAVCNALFAATGTRIRTLPIVRS